MLQLGLSPDYVLDKIESYEIASLMKYSYYRHKDSWEQSRLISFLVAQSNSTKKLQLTDIIKFQWEKEEEENKKKSESTVTNEELEQMMREADKIRKIKFG